MRSWSAVFTWMKRQLSYQSSPEVAIKPNQITSHHHSGDFDIYTPIARLAQKKNHYTSPWAASYQSSFYDIETSPVPHRPLFHTHFNGPFSVYV